ncbi:CBS domain-containing protein [Amphibacillus sediminis]|uniref:CBS domain-containing protein n=1 Tax=Amphibacillus sediminis TaxID=360185 RepID=UPI000832D883|nr:CBS domain-containing protein [Amphibacillus sediminis]
MFVRSIMVPSYACHVCLPTDSLKSALTKLEKMDIEAMPVLSNEREYLGMLGKQDIYRAYFLQDQDKDVFLTVTTVQDVVNHSDLYIYEDEVFEQTLTTFKQFAIIAVVDEHRHFKGIVTRFDVLERFKSTFGMNRSGIRLALATADESGRLNQLTDILKQVRADIISLTTFDEADRLIRRIIVKVSPAINQKKIKQKLEHSGFKILSIKECAND